MQFKRACLILRGFLHSLMQIRNKGALCRQVIAVLFPLTETYFFCVKKMTCVLNCCSTVISNFLFDDVCISLLFRSNYQGHQLRGIRGLFNRSSKSSVDTNSGGLRKRSLSDHLLRRTASAPAKGRKKTKMALSESVASMSEQKNGMDMATEDEGTSVRVGGVEKSLQPRARLTHRPISMPLDRLLQGQLSICSPEKERHDLGADAVIGEYFTWKSILRLHYILELKKRNILYLFAKINIRNL